MRIKLCVLFTLFFLALALPAQAMAYFVGPTGSDANSCATAQTITTPKLTIASALPCPQAGDTLYIRGGTYVTRVTDTAANGTNWTTGAVTIAAYPSETVTIQPTASNDALRIDNKSYHIWQRIVFDGINTGGEEGMVAIVSSDHIRIEDSEIKNCNWTCITIIYGETSAIDHQILRNHIHDGDRCTTCNPGHGIYASGDSGMSGVNLEMLIDGNTIHGFQHNDYGIHVYSGASGTNVSNGVTIRNNTIYDATSGGILVQASVTVPAKIYNNVVHGLGVTAIGIQLYNNLTNTEVYGNTIYGMAAWCIDVDTNGGGNGVIGALIKNNILINCAAGPVRISSLHPSTVATVQFNNFNGNGNGNAVLDQNGNSTINSNITTAPGFVDAATLNFALLTSSLNKEAGTPLASVPTDIIGTVRPQGALYDIGAYEFIVGGGGGEINVGTVAGMTALGGNVRKLTFTCTADSADGSFPATAVSLKFEGRLLMLVTNPGTTAPTDNYDLTLTNQHGYDVLQGLGANRDTATTEAVNIVFTGTSSNPVVDTTDTLTLTITNNAVNSAGIVIELYYTLGG